jgi:hypothetical protein
MTLKAFQDISGIGSAKTTEFTILIGSPRSFECLRNNATLTISKVVLQKELNILDPHFHSPSRIVAVTKPPLAD